MKISIGSKIFDGPWGGGNLFVINLKNYLIDKGHEVIHDLSSDDIDLILMTQPLKKSESASYSISDIIKYVKYVNNNCLVLHRINECDERKDTNYVNESIIDASKYADGRIFVSQWIKNLYENIGMNMDNSHVILSGSNKTVFNSKNRSIKEPDEAYRFVTHHWGNNWNKGFDNYQQLDQLVADESFKYDIEFTYIGNETPENRVGAKHYDNISDSFTAEEEDDKNDPTRAQVRRSQRKKRNERFRQNRRELGGRRARQLRRQRRRSDRQTRQEQFG